MYLGILFRQIPGYPDYWVSQCGKVLSTRKSIPHILKEIFTADGYVSVGLYTKPRHCKLKRIHRLVWETWMGPIEFPLVLNHLNGIKTDNKLSNLEKTTQANNVQHSYQLGLQVYTFHVTNPKLTPENVLEIRELLDKGVLSIQNIADLFNVSSRTIYHIRSREIWNHI